MHDDPQAQVRDDAQRGVQGTGGHHGLVLTGFKNELLFHVFLR
ncbi:hypothetical protein [Deinococcus sp. JMULE3]|nr:hypothetical protein [Deinococcus sp. JMULE3]